jgi:hypothetical protein
MRNLPWGTFITCPSAHVASSLAAGLVLLRFQPWVGGIFLFIALSIIVATMAVQSANGGLIPWQAGIATPDRSLSVRAGRRGGPELLPPR